MLDLPNTGLFRTTAPLPGHESAIPKDVLVFVGESSGGKFVVRPGQNRNNRWYWGEPTIPLRSPTWARTLKALPAEGFYTLPETLTFDGGGKWLQHAVVQLGYNERGQGIVFVAQRRESESENRLLFSDRGRIIEDDFLARLVWAPILPIADDA